MSHLMPANNFLYTLTPTASDTRDAHEASAPKLAASQVKACFATLRKCCLLFLKDQLQDFGTHGSMTIN